MRTCIVSFFMPNIHPATVELQSKVVEKFNKSKLPHLKVQCPMWTKVDNPGDDMDEFMRMNDSDPNLKYDAFIIVDIDCVPVSDKTFDYMVEKISQGYLVGNIQRSNHIQNNKHVFCAPSLIGFSLETFNKMGRPTFRETTRGDTAEELTYKAEENGIPIEMWMPARYEAAPVECEYWPLADGMPVYGIGTTFTIPGIGDASYHNFQIRIPGNQKRFASKCEAILAS